jgi:hypothetical protein
VNILFGVIVVSCPTDLQINFGFLRLEDKNYREFTVLDKIVPEKVYVSPRKLFAYSASYQTDELVSFKKANCETFRHHFG